MWGFMAGLIPHIRGGSLRALAVGSTERSPALPDVPTVAEAGVPGYEAVSWIGMVAPAGTPGPVDGQALGRGARGDAGKGRGRQSGQRRLRDRGEQARGVPPGDGARLRQIRQARPTCSRRRSERYDWTRIKADHGAGVVRRAASMPQTLPAEVRQKLGWLLLDHLRVCSIGARLPWSDWSRRYVGLVGKAGASHVLFSRRDASIRSTRRSSTSPSVRASTPTTPMSARCCIPASRRGRRRWRSPSTPARRGRRCWPRWLPATRPSSASVLRCSRAISSAASRAPAPATASAPRRPPGGCCFTARIAAQKIADALGLAGGYASGLAQFYYSGGSAKRIHAAHAAEGGVSAALLASGGLQRAERHHRRAGRLCPRLRRRFQSGADRGGARPALPSDGCAGEVARGGGAGRRRHRRRCWSCAQQHEFAGDDIASMALGIPKIIQGRLTNPHPVDLQAAQMCLPFSVALAVEDRAGAGRHRDPRRCRISRPGSSDQSLLRPRGAHDDCARRRGRGREQRAFDRGAGQRDAARRPHALASWCRRPRAARRSPFTGEEHEARFTQELSSRVQREGLRRDRRDVARSRPARSALARAGVERCLARLGQIEQLVAQELPRLGIDRLDRGGEGVVLRGVELDDLAALGLDGALRRPLLP